MRSTRLAFGTTRRVAGVAVDDFLVYPALLFLVGYRLDAGAYGRGPGLIGTA